MARLFLIRHGEPQAAWGEADDPGLSALGHAQARAVADALPAGLAIWSSPMARCRDTAAPYASRQGRLAQIEPRVSEVATPAGAPDRRLWLEQNFPWRAGAGGRDWSSLGAELHTWRANVIAAACEAACDTAVFTHFIAINALVAAATGQSATIVCRPNHASITELALRNGTLRLVALGESMHEGEVR